MVKTAPEDLLKKRMKHLPVAIDKTFEKLVCLINEADEYRMPVDVKPSARFDELRSRFLTNPQMVNDLWDTAIREARKNNRG